MGAYEHTVKSKEFLDATSWARHATDLGRHERTRYLHLFPTRFRRAKPYLSIVRVLGNTASCNNLVNSLRPIAVLIDDRLHPYIDYPRKVREGRVREKHRKRLMLLADNVAYYAYWCTAVLGRSGKVREIDY